MNLANNGMSAINAAMRLLAEDDRVIFLGQTVAYPGSPVFRSLDGVPMERRLEMPVAEELQMGIAIGLGLRGFVTVSIYPRIDFLLRAMDQLVNHLDKLAEMSQGGYRPRVIVRTRIGERTPLDPGPQHSQDHTEVLIQMLKNTCVLKVSRVRMDDLDVVMGIYRRARILVEQQPVLVVEGT